MNLRTVWILALHEMRTHRRLVRTYIFILVSLFICTIYFWGVTLSYMRGASQVPMLGVISPRYILALLGGSFIALFCSGILLLTFDQLKRDENCRIHEVVSSKPTSNFELFTGRLLGVSITMAIPMVCFLFAIVLFGLVAETFSFKIGEPVEPWSVFSFVCLDIAPNFLFFGSLAVLFSLLLKSRLLAILLTICSIVSLFWLSSRLPLDISRPLQTVSGNVLFPSELTPTILTPVIFFNRLALLLMAVGLLYWSSCIYERITLTPVVNLAVGTGSFCLGLAVMGTMFGIKSLEQGRIDQWIEIHDQHFVPSAFPDVHEISGHVDIKPGRSIELNLTLEVSVSASQDSEFILFSLNPGLHISHLAVANEEVVDPDFRHGLLKIPSVLFTYDRTELKISAKGRPDTRFAYLDSKHVLSEIVGLDNRQLRQLGTENSIFRSEFVALLPGIKWYPTAGTATNEDDWERRQKDFFGLNIEVSVPRDWLVAGPSRREHTEETKRSTFRFRSSASVPEIALVGSKFESASTEVEGILFEVLYSKKHRKTYEKFGLATDKIRDELHQLIYSMDIDGYRFPINSATLVAVPSTLRVFGGGVGMDTAMCPPGIVMIRESTLPTLPLQTFIDHDLFERFNNDDQDEERLSWMIDSLAMYLQHPMFESNLQLGFFRHQFGEQTSASQDGALGLNILWERFIVQSADRFAMVDFDFHLALDRHFVNLASVDLREIFGNYSVKHSSNVSQRMFEFQHATMNAPEVWDMAEQVSLLDLDQGTPSALTLRAKQLRAKQLVEYFDDTIQWSRFRNIVVEGMSRFRGNNFVFEDLVNVFAAHNVSLVNVSGDLLTTAGLPGFFVSNSTSQRLESDDQRTFETAFVIQNKEPVSGPVKLAGTYQRAKDDWTGFLDRVPFPSMLVKGNQTLRVVVESPVPVETIWIEPYLSLNRMDLRLNVPLSEEFQEIDGVNRWNVSIKSIEEIELPQVLSSSIIVDDLNPGFSVVNQRSTSTNNSGFVNFVRGLFDKSDVALDAGLPKYRIRNRPTTKNWHRWTDPTAFGNYRRTFAISKAGDGSAVVKFNTTLPKIGVWMLEFYLPEGHFVESSMYRRGHGTTFTMHYVGNINLEIHTDSAVIDHTFDAPNSPSGWNTIGTYELSGETVDVLITNKTDKNDKYVFADAIRWTPVETEE